MNRFWSIFLFFALLSGTIPLQSKMGCLSNTKKLKERFDTKAYYPVECYCPCEYYHKRMSLNKCDECGHFHDSKPFIMVTVQDEHRVTGFPHVELSARQSVDMLIKDYQKRHKSNP